MPTKPKKVESNTNPADLLSAVQSNASQQFRDVIPDDTIDALYDNDSSVRLNALHEIGSAILQYDAVQNEFITSLINRIAFVIIKSKVYYNPWAFLKNGYLELGETVEEIFIKLCDSHKYDPELAEQKWMEREIPDVASVFHTVNYKNFYKRTIQDNDLRTAFLSWDGLSDLVRGIIQTLYTSANLDEFLLIKYLIARAYLNGHIKTVQVPEINKGNADDIAITIRSLSDSLTFMSGSYNELGVDTYTDKDDQYLILTPLYNSTIDVGALASAFNMDKVEFMGHRMIVDSFAQYNNRIDKMLTDYNWYTPFTDDEINKLKKLVGLIVDYDWFRIYDQTFTMRTMDNGEGLYRQYWLHVHKIISYSPFNNAIALTTDVPDNPISQLDLNIVSLS